MTDRREHAVAIVLSLPADVPHTEVQSRVLMAAVKAFEDRGPVEVSGFDLAKAKKVLEDMTRERNECHSAWQRAEREVERLRGILAEKGISS